VVLLRASSMKNGARAGREQQGRRSNCTAALFIGQER
jgi:hypothetical protein